jgi:dTDP-4-amino-4,6-dideoxygalactose transaminase
VYGNPCKLEEIQDIADKYGLKLIYDAAHAFGVKINGISIANFGDLSVLSFHATKVFNTFEGGAIVCHDEKTKKRIDFLKNFGFANETTVVEPGINAKMNEFQAALGLLQLKYINKVIEKRKQISLAYRRNIGSIPGIKVLDDISNVQHNYAYFPILIDKDKYGKSRDDVYEGLKKHNIYTRRYFYPLISQFPSYRGLESAKEGLMPVAEKVTQEVLCLPIYPDLDEKIVLFISNLIKSVSL